MTRQKKSRKPSAFVAKTDKKQKQKVVKEQKRPKKTKGHSAGNRNNPEATAPLKAQASAQSAVKDVRHGSKKAIDLTPQVEPDVQLQTFDKPVKLQKVKQPQITPEQELEAIESDERLLELLARKENDELITGKDAKYFNAKMARHQELVELLGLDMEEDDEQDESDDERSLAERWEDDDWEDDWPQTKDDA